MADDEIFFTKRISKISGNLIISIPVDETKFEHKDLVKVTLLRKADKNLVEEEDTKEDDKKDSTKTNNE
jgi:hypothetical protein